ncbi:hypothetical protein PHYPSEUDO_000646 [Phytophthora pseudosyringae]|uniref:Uncharacterized protein n=1 Tax=Phytophthora pseudosyringae TaxID=221518 RepID=A0A8T1W251_9STRA|nr:hypothetical protein PHYPSEUDO_000646 [Phytophthora pseudosyringae]
MNLAVVGRENPVMVISAEAVEVEMFMVVMTGRGGRSGRGGAFKNGKRTMEIKSPAKMTKFRFINYAPESWRGPQGSARMKSLELTELGKWFNIRVSVIGKWEGSCAWKYGYTTKSFKKRANGVKSMPKKSGL